MTYKPQKRLDPPASPPPDSETKTRTVGAKLPISVRFDATESQRLDLAKEILLKGWPNTTPTEAAEAANRVYELVLSAELQEQPDE